MSIQLTTERRENYSFIQDYLSSLSPSDKMSLSTGVIKIDETHSFYVKNTYILNEAIIHSELTQLAIHQNFGGILLLFGYSESNIKKAKSSSEESETSIEETEASVEETKSNEITYNLFIELSEGEKHDLPAKIQVIESLLWMHNHDYIHSDIYNNNIFQLGGIYVIGDFDRSVHSNNIIFKFNEITRFFKTLPSSITGQFSNLLLTIPGISQKYIKCEPSLIGFIMQSIRTQQYILTKYKNNESLLEDVNEKLAFYESLLKESNTILESPELMQQLYEEFVRAFHEITHKYDGKSGGRHRRLKKNKKTRKTRKTKKTKKTT